MKKSIRNIRSYFDSCVSLTLTASREIQAPWSLKAKYTPFLFTGIDLTSVLMMTSLLVLNLPSPAAILPETNFTLVLN